MVWNFFVATDGHDHAERYLEEDDHHEELLNAFELTSVSTGEPLDLEATYVDGELELVDGMYRSNPAANFATIYF